MAPAADARWQSLPAVAASARANGHEWLLKPLLRPRPRLKEVSSCHWLACHHLKTSLSFLLQCLALLINLVKENSVSS